MIKKYRRSTISGESGVADMTCRRGGLGGGVFDKLLARDRVSDKLVLVDRAIMEGVRQQGACRSIRGVSRGVDVGLGVDQDVVRKSIDPYILQDKNKRLYGIFVGETSELM